MAIRPVRELPVRRGGFAANESFVEADMREFVRKGMDVAVLEYADHKKEGTKAAVQSFIRQHPAETRGVQVGIRQGKVYVWREAVR